MIKSCLFLLLLAAYSVDCNVTSAYSQKETASAYFGMISKVKNNTPTSLDMISKGKNDITTCYNCPKTLTKKPLDCADILQMGHNKSGVYEIWPVNRVTEGKHLYVYCDMVTNGGGWTVIQRRGDFQRLKDYFYKDWKSYKEGFGEIEKDFWLGNDNIFALTNQQLYSVRFDLKDFHQKERYDKFWMDDEDHKYTLHILDYSGDAGDAMIHHNNQSFTTKDRKNDKISTGNCAEERKGGWWYNGCALANLNGLYHKGKIDTRDGITWETWQVYEPLQWTEIKIRPKNFRVFYS